MQLDVTDAWRSPQLEKREENESDNICELQFIHTNASNV